MSQRLELKEIKKHKTHTHTTRNSLSTIKHQHTKKLTRWIEAT